MTAHDRGAAARSRDDLAAHPRPHGGAAARTGRRGRDRPRRDGGGATARVRRGSTREPGVRGRRAADRLRAVDLEAVHGCAHARGGACGPRSRACARGRHGMRIPGRAPRAHRGRGVLDRAPRGAGREGAGKPAAAADREPSAPARRRLPGIARGGAIRRDRRGRRGAPGARNRCSTSSPAAAGSSSRSGPTSRSSACSSVPRAAG